MDFLRFGYEAKMRTVHGQPPVDVVWFPAPEGAQLFKGPTVFGSRNWSKDHRNDGIGEQEARPCCLRRDIVWYSGAPPAPYRGVDYCGSEGAARGGAVVGRDPLFWSNDVGQAPCCETPFYVGAGGEVEGGESFVVPVIWVVCACGGEVEGGAALLYTPEPLSTGGEVEGGAAVVVPPALVGVGGEVEGGAAVVGYPPQVGAGGEVEGGLAVGVAVPYYFGVGGEVEGGFALLAGVTQYVGAGGELEGGAADPMGLALVVGGELEGGAATLAGVTQATGAGGELEGGAAVMPQDWLAGYSYRKPILYNTAFPSADLLDYPKHINITADSDIAAHISSGPIAFTRADGVTEVPFGTYDFTGWTAGYIRVRVRFDVISASANTGDVMGYIYYGASGTPTDNKPDTVSNGYLLWLDMGQDAGGSAPQFLDWVSNTNVGTSQGGMSISNRVTGAVGFGQSFDGSNDCIAVDLALTAPGGSYTVEACFNYTSTAQTRFLVAWGRTTTDTPLVAIGPSVAAGAQLRYIWRNDAGTATDIAYTTNVNDGAWHHVAARRASSTHTFWVGGAQRNSGSGSGTITLNTFTVGAARRTGTGQYYNGSVDEVRVSSEARADAWLAWASVDDTAVSTTYTLGAEETP